MVVFSVSGYGQFWPVSWAAEVICQRRTQVVLRELQGGSTHFSWESNCGISGSSLARSRARPNPP
jgi:hypothetical protein